MVPDLARYHWIVLNSSAGKDSQAMLDVVVERADRAGVPCRRLLVAHADLGRVEWPGTRALAEEQARHYGLDFVAVSRPQGDLLEHIAHRGMFPSPAARYCTSAHKRDQILKIFTRLADRTRRDGAAVCSILNCLGMRAEESPARARRRPFAPNPLASNGRRWVDDWLPLHAWTTAQVWDRIRASGVRPPPAYDLGLPRRSALLLAGKHNPEYVGVERAIGHRFRVELSLAETQEAIARGEQPGRVPDWTM
jgi:3'-phosphoadenosine 5'-phosphosulfate sulfotransferase (PAPS reductase)/FAD synthetase